MDISEKEARKILEKKNINIGGAGLTYHAQEGDLTTVELMIKAGVDADSFGASEKEGKKLFPLNQAASRGHTKVVVFLLEFGATPNLVDGLGNTALFYAIRSKHMEVVNALIKGGADVNWKDESGETALFKALRSKYAEGVKALIKGGADVNLKNKKGINALHLAKKKKGHEIAEILSDAGAKDLSANEVSKIKRKKVIKLSVLFVSLSVLLGWCSTLDYSSTSSSGGGSYSSQHTCKWCGNNYSHNGYFHIESSCEKWSTDPGFDGFCTMKCCMDSWNSGIH